MATTVHSVQDVREVLNERGRGSFFRRVWTICGLGWLFDAMDQSALGLTLPLIMSTFGISKIEGGLAASGTNIGAIAGALISSSLSDRFGRRKMIIVNLLIYCLGSILLALSPNFEWLVAARALQGVGLGGEYPMISIYINEVTPKRDVSRAQGLTSSFFAYGYVLTSLISIFVVPALGFRGLFIALTLPALLIVWIRRALPESPVYLAQKGRFAEAEAVLQVIRDGSPQLRAADRSKDVESAGSNDGDSRLPIFPLIYISAVGILLQLAYYGYNTWVPTVVSDHVASRIGTYGITTLVFTGLVVGYLLGAFIGDRLNGNWFLILSYLVFGVPLFFFGWANSTVLVVVLGWLSAVGFGFSSIATYSWVPRQFSARLRGTGVGITNGIGRVGGVVGPTLVAALSTNSNFGVAFAVLGTGTIVAAVIIGAIKRPPVSAIAARAATSDAPVHASTR
jgi:MFS transporter, putative metabolite:H+ symporter